MATDVFISYCRKDKIYLNLLIEALEGYEMQIRACCWTDTRVAPGDLWMAELNAALTSARLGILMVTPGFLASTFIKQHELPVLLRRAVEGSLTLVPIPVRHVAWQAQAFSAYQSILDPAKPLAGLRRSAIARGSPSATAIRP